MTSKDILFTIIDVIKITEFNSKEFKIKGENKLNHAINMIECVLPGHSLAIGILKELIEIALNVLKERKEL